jgi:hypothetical protein
VDQSVVSSARSVLRLALAGQSDAIAQTFRTVVGRDGAGGAYDVAWCLAAAVLGPNPPGAPPGTWSLDFPGIEDAGYAVRWVARFLCTYANADAATGAALFRAATADGHLDECLLTLAGSAAATIRRRRPGAGD